MSMLQQNAPWRNVNSLIRYPFRDGDPMKFTNGVDIPLSLLVDAIVTTQLDPEGWRLTEVAIGTALTFTFENTNGDALIGVSAVGPFAGQVVQLTDVSGLLSGQIVLGLGADYIALNPVAVPATAASGSGYLNPAVIFTYRVEGVWGIKLMDGTIVAGNIAISGGDGITVVVDGDTTSGTIQLNATGKPADCSASSPMAPPIKSIVTDNGEVFPDANGRIFLQNTDVLQFFGDGSKVTVQDALGGLTQ
jgi:hypothetical protein